MKLTIHIDPELVERYDAARVAMIPPTISQRFAAAVEARETHDCDLARRRVEAAAALVFDCLRSADAEQQALVLRILGTRWAEHPGMLETIATIAIDLDRCEGLPADAIETSAELAAELRRNEEAAE
jgi:hypothetical protein